MLDHFAPPVGWLGPMGKAVGRTQAQRDALFEEWQAGISELAEAHPNIVAKLSGTSFPMLGMPTARWSRADIAENVGPLIRHTVDSFGPDRVTYGSNFPMDKAITEYPNLPGALVDVLTEYGDDVLLSNAFRDNAQRIYSPS